MTIPEETKHYTSRKYATHEQWLAGRANSIGASEVALVMGIAPSSWGTSMDLWERKRRPAVNDRGNADTARGSAAEAHIRELLRIETGLEVHDMTGRIFRSRRFPWLTCSLDAAIAHGDGTFTVVEIKDVRWTASWRRTASWRNGVPLHYLYQCAAQMLVTGSQAAILLARIIYDFGDARDWMERLATRTVREVPYIIRRDDVKGQFAGIARETKAFWDCVKSGTLPPIHVRGRR